MNDHLQGPQQIESAIRRSVEKAKAFFLYDDCGVYRKTYTWFKTRVKNPGGCLSDCLVIPPPPQVQRSEVGVILPADENMRTHWVNNREARIMVKIGETNQLIDPFDFKFGTN